MDLREIEKMVVETKGGIEEKKESLISILSRDTDDAAKLTTKPSSSSSSSIDLGSALQLFLDHIPISSIPGINNSSSGTHHFSLSLSLSSFFSSQY